jgi:hypothetical protein
LTAQGEQEGEAPAHVDIVERLRLKREEGIGTVRIAVCDVRHQCDDCVFLDSEWASV